jgi:alpha-1,2-mannosyltransferase
VSSLALTAPTRDGLRRALDQVLPYFVFGYIPVVLGGAIALAALFTDRLWDFHVFLRAGHDVLNGNSPYPLPLLSQVAHENTFVYPPQTALAFAPLALLSFYPAAVIFLAILYASVALTLRLLEVRDWRCYGAAFLMAPILSGIANGAISCLLALGVALVWRYRDNWKAAALAAAAVMTIKLFLWPLAIWLVATRRYAAAAGAAVVGAAATLAAWALIGFAGIGDYVHLLRLLAKAEQAEGFSPIALALSLGAPSTAARAFALVVGGLAVVGLIVLARRRDGDRLSLTMAIAAALLLSPIVWMHYFSLLLVPLVLARPRLSRFWLVPMVGFWFTGGQSGGEAVFIVIALVTAGWTIWGCLRPAAPARSGLLVPATAD